MACKLLITRPNHDLETSYLSIWSKDLISLAKSKPLKCKDLPGKKANRIEFEKYIEKQKPDLILLNGHGNESTVAGYNDEPLVSANKNAKVLANSVVHALACNSSEVLGKKAIAVGAKAYLGYNFPFMFLTDKNNECRPGYDALANIFKEPALEAPKQLINGKTPAIAYKKAKKKYQDSIHLFSTSEAQEEAESIRFALFANMVSLSLEPTN